MDSMTIYRGMDIGTAKPTREERSDVPHHLLDLREPHDEFSTAEYMTAALGACEQIISRGHIPLFVGGTGLYLRSLLRGVFEGPSPNWELRRQWEQMAAEQGAAALHAQLERVDPTTAKRLHPNDQRRVIRALEIHALTGCPASELQQESPLPAEQRPWHVYWLNPDRDTLRQRIDRRVDAMLDAGLVAEVSGLLRSRRGWAEPPDKRSVIVRSSITSNGAWTSPKRSRSSDTYSPVCQAAGDVVSKPRRTVTGEYPRK